MVPVLMGAVGDMLALGAFEAGNSGAVSDLSPSMAGLQMQVEALAWGLLDVDRQTDLPLAQIYPGMRVGIDQYGEQKRGEQPGHHHQTQAE